VVLFDPDTIADTATYDVPQSVSRGVARVYVNGACAYLADGAAPRVRAHAGRMLARAS